MGVSERQDVVSISRALASADHLRSLVLTVIDDARAPVSIRNHCHRLMLAIEKNNQTLIDESLASLEQEAERAGYPLPPSIPSAAPKVVEGPGEHSPEKTVDE
jgi:nucleotide-binding universal stress UspA family protein